MSEKHKRKPNELIDEALKITPLGAGNEVGRSCIIVEYKNRKLMLDCGIHPAHKGIAALPYFDEIDPSSLDAILITHFHLDHAAGLPYFLAKTDFKGRVFMTHPTKSIYQLLLQDYIRVSAIANPDPLFDEVDLNNSMERIEAINFHQVVNLDGIRFWAYNAGHVLGAAMFMIEIAGVRILYTGDYSRKDDRHLKGAELPETKPDVLIIESTYGIQRLESISKREKEFTAIVEKILLRGGRCLIPVFALGRAQELLLILDEHWRNNPSLHSYPVYYASSLARKCMTVYQTYVNMMNERVQKQFEAKNPFNFDFVRFLKGMDDFHDVGPSVVFASPGMLQNGFSRQLFEEWCGEEKNGVIIPGYIVDGTLAKTVMLEPKQIEAMDGSSLPLRMSINYVTFSAHADFNETSSFIEQLQPPHIILVHGDSNEMSRLNKALTIQVRGKKTEISTPKNCQTVELEFGSEKIAKTVGSLSLKKANENENLKGILVLKDYEMTIMDKTDLSDFTPLVCASIFQSVKVPFNFTADCLISIVSEIFQIEEDFNRDNIHSDFKQFFTSEKVKLLLNTKQGFVIIEWMSGHHSDVVADSLISILSNAETLPSRQIAILTTKSTKETEKTFRLKSVKQNLEKILKAIFGEKSITKSKSNLIIKVDESVIAINSNLKIENCEKKDEKLYQMAEKVIKMCFDSFGIMKIDEKDFTESK